MIVADSSALIAILEEEPEHQNFKTVLGAAARRVVSAVTLYEQASFFYAAAAWTARPTCAS